MPLKLLKRRQFIAGLGLSALLFNLTSQNSMMRANAVKRSPSVLVVGVGLSGLYAALLLKKVGVTVTVLEGPRWWACSDFRRFTRKTRSRISSIE